jgi:hypothetical protein
VSDIHSDHLAAPPVPLLSTPIYNGSNGQVGAPIPWPIFVQKLMKGSIIPFLGAGASAYCADQAGGAPPSGARLSAQIAGEAGLAIGCNREGCGRPIFDLARLASYYQNCVSTRPELDDFLRMQISNPHFNPNPLHYLLAKMAAIKPMLIITTNYDDLLEKAFDAPANHATPVPYDVVVSPCDALAYAEESNQDGQASEAFFGSEHAGSVYVRQGGDSCSDFVPIAPNLLNLNLESRSVIYKIHGSVAYGNRWLGGFLIAEEDYARFLGRMDRGGIIPDAIISILRKKRKIQIGPARSKVIPVYSLFFLGYSLSDWNLRVLLEELRLGRGSAGEEQHYAILRQQGVEAQVAQSLLRKKNIEPYDCDLKTFVDQMERSLNAETLS